MHSGRHTIIQHEGLRNDPKTLSIMHITLEVDADASLSSHASFFCYLSYTVSYSYLSDVLCILYCCAAYFMCVRFIE